MKIVIGNYVHIILAGFGNEACSIFSNAKH
jgi:hypothetical protein